jgi:hypothetical protein
LEQHVLFYNACQEAAAKALAERRAMALKQFDEICKLEQYSNIPSALRQLTRDEAYGTYRAVLKKRLDGDPRYAK